MAMSNQQSQKKMDPEIQLFFEQVTKSCYPDLLVKCPELCGDTSKRWIMYCGCGKEGGMGLNDGEVVCNSPIEDQVQKSIFREFWKLFVSGKLNEFEAFASKITGRKLHFEGINSSSSVKNAISLLLFYTLKKCEVNINYIDFMRVIQDNKVPRSVLEKSLLHIPICLNDDHVICRTNTGNYRTRLFVKGNNQEVLTWFFQELTLANNHSKNKEKIFYGKTLLQWIEAVSDINVHKDNTVTLARTPFISKVKMCKIPDSRRFKDVQKSHELCALMCCEACQFSDKFMVVLSQANPLLFVEHDSDLEMPALDDMTVADDFQDDEEENQRVISELFPELAEKKKKIDECKSRAGSDVEEEEEEKKKISNKKEGSKSKKQKTV